MSAWELRRFTGFLSAAVFLDRTDLAPWLLALEEQLRSAVTTPPDPRTIWETVWPERSFDRKRYRQQLTYLGQALDRYLAIRRFLASPGLPEEFTAHCYVEAGNARTAARYMRRAAKQLERAPLRDTDYLQRRLRIATIAQRTDESDARTQAESLTRLAAYADHYFVQLRLRQACQLLALQTVHPSDTELALVREVLQLVYSDSALLAQPAIAFYYHAYRALSEPDAEPHFRTLLTLIDAHSAALEDAAYNEVYTLLINFGIRRLNEGDTAYLPITFDLFRIGVEEKILWRGEELSLFTYNNTFAAALKLRRYAWAEDFLRKYRPALPALERTSIFNFCLAQLRYEQGRLPEAMQLLIGYSGHGNHLLQLQAKITLLKIYFDLEELEPAGSLLHALTTYLNRHRQLGYHRTPYAAVVRWCRHLLAAPRPLPPLQAAKLREELATVSIPSLWNWLASLLAKWER